MDNIILAFTILLLVAYLVYRKFFLQVPREISQEDARTAFREEHRGDAIPFEQIRREVSFVFLEPPKSERDETYQKRNDGVFAATVEKHAITAGSSLKASNSFRPSHDDQVIPIGNFSSHPWQ